MRERTACRLHGGKSLRGVASPSWRGTDLLSAVLPQRLRHRYVASLEDPNLLSLRRQIALTEARIMELAGQLTREDGTTPRARRTWEAFKSANRAQDPDRIREALNLLETAMAWEATQAEVWSELRKERELLRKLKDSENDVLLKEHYVISIERALALTAAMQGIFLKGLEQYVSNPTERQAVRRHVAAEYPRLVSGRGGAEDHAGERRVPAVLDVTPVHPAPTDPD